MKNEKRGEIELKINGRDYVMRPTFEALIEIESETQKSFVKLISHIRDGDMSVTDAIKIVQIGIKGGGTARKDLPSGNDILTEIYKSGGALRSPIMGCAALYLIRVNNQMTEAAGEEAEGEPGE